MCVNYQHNLGIIHLAHGDSSKLRGPSFMFFYTDSNYPHLFSLVNVLDIIKPEQDISALKC